MSQITIHPTPNTDDTCPVCLSPLWVEDTARGPMIKHVNLGQCSVGEESAVHMGFKLIARDYARALGFQAELEVTDQVDGRWRADLLVRRLDGRLTAVEVQVSSIVAWIANRRDARMRASGLNRLWLAAPHPYNGLLAVPHAGVAPEPPYLVDGASGFDGKLWVPEVLDLRTFLDDVLNDRRRWVQRPFADRPAWATVEDVLKARARMDRLAGRPVQLALRLNVPATWADLDRAAGRPKLRR